MEKVQKKGTKEKKYKEKGMNKRQLLPQTSLCYETKGNGSMTNCLANCTIHTIKWSE